MTVPLLPSGYSPEFFFSRKRLASESAKAVLPWVIERTRPLSVVDVGCGTGSWLAEVRRAGIVDVLGLDGDWVPRKELEIPAENFKVADFTEPLNLGRRFDLVISLEVAEHLVADISDVFIAQLASLGDIVLFSGAIPHQGGTGHVNEQWPDYWISRFEREDFACVDCIRPTFWRDERVAFWYAQNSFLFVRQTELGKYPELVAANGAESWSRLPIVHPAMLSSVYTALSDPGNYSIRGFLRVLPRLVMKRIRASSRKRT